MTASIRGAGCSRGVVRAVAAGALLASAGLARAGGGDIWSWNAGDGFWMDAGNWLPNSVPGPGGLPVERVYLGDLPGVQNSTVWLNHAVGSGTLGIRFLEITDGMTLDMNGREFGLLDTDIRLWDAGTRLLVRPSAGINAYDLFTDQIFISSASEMAMLGGEVLSRDLFINGLLSGSGRIDLASNTVALDNGGVIAPDASGLTIVQQLAGRVDLDGMLSNGEVLLTVPFSRLTIEGDTLHDTFQGTITMGTGSLLDMQMSDGWEATASSLINVASSMAGAAAQIDGGHFAFGGELNIGGSHGHLRVLADATFGANADVFLGNDDRLEFDGATTVQGGVYDLSAGARVDFDGPTTMAGGVFNALAPQTGQAGVHLDGATVWQGTTTFNGVARQNGPASVSSPATIHADVLDMDGSGGTTWTINHALTVHADSLDFGSSIFNGVLNMNAGAVGRLTIHLSDPQGSWTMAGDMNLAGLGVLTTTRVEGSPMVVTGDVSMASGLARITADTTYRSGNVSIAANGTLRMTGSTRVQAATVFGGTGTLENAGAMALYTGADLGSVGLLNTGSLSIGEAGAGIASVDRISGGPASTLRVDLAGYVAGTEHDLLLVAGGGATLDGALEVSLLGLNGGAIFSPNIGDEFTILSSLGPVSGAFSNDPVSQSGGLTYEWTVIYNPNTVVLRLDSVVPAPGSALLAAMGLGLIARRRRA